MVASSSRRSACLGRAGVAARRERCGGGGGGGGGGVVVTGSVARCLLGTEIVCEGASGAFSRARVAASHTGARQSGVAAVEGASDAGRRSGRQEQLRSLLPFHIRASLQLRSCPASVRLAAA